MAIVKWREWWLRPILTDAAMPAIDSVATQVSASSEMILSPAAIVASFIAVATGVQDPFPTRVLLGYVATEGTREKVPPMAMSLEMALESNSFARESAERKALASGFRPDFHEWSEPTRPTRMHSAPVERESGH